MFSRQELDTVEVHHGAIVDEQIELERLGRRIGHSEGVAEPVLHHAARQRRGLVTVAETELAGADRPGTVVEARAGPVVRQVRPVGQVAPVGSAGDEDGALVGR